MTRNSLIITAVVLAYVTGAMLTFGYGVNRVCTFDWKTGEWNAGCDRAEDAARYFFMMWPVYWIGRVAIEVTKP
jgi:hypothetical protein